MCSGRSWIMANDWIRLIKKGMSQRFVILYWPIALICIAGACTTSDAPSNPLSPVLDTVREFHSNGMPSVVSARVNGQLSGRTTWYREDGRAQVVAHYLRDRLRGSRLFYDSLGRLIRYENYSLLNELSYVVRYRPDGTVIGTDGCSISGLELISSHQDSLSFALDLANPENCSTRLMISPNGSTHLETPDSNMVRVTFNGHHWIDDDTIRVSHLIMQGNQNIDSCIRKYSVRQLMQLAPTTR